MFVIKYNGSVLWVDLVFLVPQVSLSAEELQALGTAITMVTQDGTTITVPTHQGDITGTAQHHVTMVTGDGKELQPVRLAQTQQSEHTQQTERQRVTTCLFARCTTADERGIIKTQELHGNLSVICQMLDVFYFKNLSLSALRLP